MPSDLLRVGSVCGLGPDLVGIHSISLAARYRVAACSTTLRQGLEKIRLARGHNCAPIFALSPAWENEFFHPSMAHSTVTAFDAIQQLDLSGKLNEAPNSKKQKIATGLLRDCLYMQDFAGPISARATKISGPISRYRVADFLPHMELASNASCPGLAVGMLRVLCNGMCTAQRFHSDEQGHTCHGGCRDRPDSFSPITLNALFCAELLSSLWRQAAVQPRRSHLLLDLIPRCFCVVSNLASL